MLLKECAGVGFPRAVCLRNVDWLNMSWGSFEELKISSRDVSLVLDNPGCCFLPYASFSALFRLRRVGDVPLGLRLRPKDRFLQT